MSGFLKMEGPDFLAFVIAVAGGYIVGSVIPNAEIAVYTSIILSYHLFLAWLVINSSGKAALSMSIPMTLVTHVACMVVALGPAVVGDHKSPVFSVFRYGIAALALFERGWLFSKERPKLSAEEAMAAEPALAIRPTAEDELAWIEYLSKRRPGMTKPGVTIRQEHEAWLKARHEQRLRQQALLQALTEAKAQTQAQEPLTGDDSLAVS